jgi:hypothetical protein
MPHLHLPIDHTDDDLVLAANVADLVGSADLYVAWSHVGGPGAVPEVEAVLREERPARPFLAAIAAFWRTLFRRPARVAVSSPVDAPRRTASA